MKTQFYLARLKPILLGVLFLTACKLSYGQVGENDATKILPPSPNAATLGEFGQIPVSLFSGKPNINIPLGQIEDGDIQVPLSLNYDAGGVRPDHHPTWVGLNWSLSAGGPLLEL